MDSLPARLCRRFFPAPVPRAETECPRTKEQGAGQDARRERAESPARFPLTPAPKPCIDSAPLPCRRREAAPAIRGRFVLGLTAFGWHREAGHFPFRLAQDRLAFECFSSRRALSRCALVAHCVSVPSTITASYAVAERSRSRGFRRLPSRCARRPRRSRS